MMQCVLVGYLLLFCDPSRSPSSITQYYPVIKEPSLFDQYQIGKQEYELRQKPSPFLQPPDNLSPGDNTQMLWQKLLMNRLHIFEEESKKASPDVIGKAATTIDKTTRQEATVKLKGMCEIKTGVQYDLNKGQLTAQSVCETIHVRTIYSTITNTYESSIFQQLENGDRVGVKSTNPSQNALVFLETFW